MCKGYDYDRCQSASMKLLAKIVILSVRGILGAFKLWGVNSRVRTFIFAQVDVI